MVGIAIAVGLGVLAVAGAIGSSAEKKEEEKKIKEGFYNPKFNPSLMYWVNTSVLNGDDHGIYFYDEDHIYVRIPLREGYWDGIRMIKFLKENGCDKYTTNKDTWINHLVDSGLIQKGEELFKAKEDYWPK